MLPFLKNSVAGGEPEASARSGCRVSRHRKDRAGATTWSFRECTRAFVHLAQLHDHRTSWQCCLPILWIVGPTIHTTGDPSSCCLLPAKAWPGASQARGIHCPSRPLEYQCIPFVNQAHTRIHCPSKSLEHRSLPFVHRPHLRLFTISWHPRSLIKGATQVAGLTHQAVHIG